VRLDRNESGAEIRASDLRCSNPGTYNLFLSEEGAESGKFILKAIDHGHIFSCGKPLSPSLANIANVKDEQLYGLYPFFRPFVTIDRIAQIASEEMSNVQVDLWEDLINSVPAAWQISPEANLAISRLLLERARFLADNIEAMARKALALESDE